MMIRANMVEDMKAIIGSFLNELNREIMNNVKLQCYMKLEDMMYMTSKVER
jgi:hypothetical protein